MEHMCFIKVVNNFDGDIATGYTSKLIQSKNTEEDIKKVCELIIQDYQEIINIMKARSKGENNYDREINFLERAISTIECFVENNYYTSVEEGNWDIEITKVETCKYIDSRLVISEIE